MRERSKTIPDPNAKRDKALADIATALHLMNRSLAEQNRLLSRIEKNSRPEQIVSNTYLERSEAVGEDSESGRDEGDLGSSAESFIGGTER
jgi:hypothetical protein